MIIYGLIGFHLQELKDIGQRRSEYIHIALGRNRLHTQCNPIQQKCPCLQVPFLILQTLIYLAEMENLVQLPL